MANRKHIRHSQILEDVYDDDNGVIKVSMPLSVIGPDVSVDGNVAVFDGTSGHAIKDGGRTLTSLAGKIETQGGTNQTGYAKGDLLYASAIDILSKLGIGSAHQSLRVNATNGIPVWMDLIDPTTSYRIWEDFLVDSSSGSMRWSAPSGGAGSGSSPTATNVDNQHPGVVLMSTGTTSTGFSGVCLGVTSGLVFGNGQVVFQAAIYIENLSTAGDEFQVRCGFADTVAAADTIVDGVYLKYDRTTSVNWIMVATNNSSKTSTASSTAVAAAGWTSIKIVVNAAGTSAEYFVNGVSIGTVSTNIPTGVGRCSNPTASIGKSAGTNNRNLYIDYAYAESYFTNAR